MALKWEIIKWVDSTSKVGWRYEDSLSDEDDNSPMTSVGAIFKETKDLVYIGGHYSPKTHQAGGVFAIPKVAIVSRKRIRIK